MKKYHVSLVIKLLIDLSDLVNSMAKDKNVEIKMPVIPAPNTDSKELKKLQKMYEKLAQKLNDKLPSLDGTIKDMQNKMEVVDSRLENHDSSFDNVMRLINDKGNPYFSKFHLHMTHTVLILIDVL